MDTMNHWDLMNDEATLTRDAFSQVLPGLARQKTLSRSVSFSGTGLHSGKKVSMTLHTAPAGSGLVFRRIDLPQDTSRLLPVQADRVLNSPLCTTLTNEDGVRVATIEHLMAALNALSIDNLVIDVDAPELPIMDGSAAVFIDMMDRAGVVELDAPRRVIRVLKKVEVMEGGAYASLSPAARDLRVSFEIDFSARAIGRQTCSLSVTEAQFRSQLARARTFCMKDDVERMHAAGLALGGSLENAIVVDGDSVMNKDGLRYEEEFVRHKALDAVGDLYMAGLPLVGSYHGVRSGHACNNALLRALLADPTAYVVETQLKGLQRSAASDFKAHAETVQTGEVPQLACA